MQYTKLKNINKYKSENINPAKTPDTVFEMYSVPIYETGHPEYLRGSQIASNKAVVEKNDILVCKINPRINRVWIVSDESDNLNIASSEWIVVRNNEYNPEFLAWYFRTPRFQKLMTSEVTGIGGSLTRAQPKSVAEYPVPVLDRNTQNEIVARLNKCKIIIDSKEQELEQLDTLVKSRFIELFGDYINEGGKPLSELATITGGLTKNSKRNAFNLKMPYLRVANVFFNRLDLNEILEIGVREDEIGKTLLQTGDLLFVERNGSIEQIGRVAIWDGSISPILHQNHLIKARFHKKTILPEFALFYFMSQEGRQQIISKSVSTSGLNTLSVNKISSLILPMPPIELQKQFAAFVAQTDKSK